MSMEEVKLGGVLAQERRELLTRRWNLPAKNKNFTGRENLLVQIADKLSQSKPLVISALHGLGGVGKTQLVTEYAYRNEEKYERILWIPAESTDQIEVAYLALGQDLKLIPEKTPPAEAIQIVKHWLTHHPRNLIIFDNAPDYKTIQDYILPSGADILITSRHTEWPEKGIEVGVFSLEECFLYFKRIVGEREFDTQEKIEELAAELGRLPLALAQATAYIRQNKISIQVYLDLYREKKAYFLSQSILPEGDQHVPVYVTWDITMARVESESALAPVLLNVFSFLHSEKIPGYLLTSLNTDEKYNPRNETVEEAKACLASYSMIASDGEISVPSSVLPSDGVMYGEVSYLSDGETPQCMNIPLVTFGDGDSERGRTPFQLDDDIRGEFSFYRAVRFDGISVHRVVQEVVKSKLKREKKLEVYAERVNDLFKSCLPDELSDNNNTLASERILLTHLEAFRRECFLEAVGFLMTIYRNLGYAKKQKDLLTSALEAHEAKFGKNHYFSSIILINLGVAYVELGMPQIGKETLDHALQIVEATVDCEHPAIAVVLSNLGNAYVGLEDFVKAVPLLERAMKIQENQYGKNSSEVGVTLSDLGAAYHCLDNLVQAEALFKQSKDILVSHYGLEHYRVATVSANLAAVYGKQGKPALQKELLEYARPIFEFHFGKSNPRAAKILSSLGDAFGALGDKQKHRELLEESLRIQEEYYGKEHLTVAYTLLRLAKKFHKIFGDTEKRKSLIERALSIFEKNLGSDHHLYLETKGHLGGVYGALGDIHMQKNILENVLPALEDCLGKEHIQVAIILVNLGTASGELGEPQKQRELIERAMPILRKRYGEKHRRFAAALSNLAAAYCRLDEHEKAKAGLEQVLNIYEQCYRKDYPEIARVKANLGEVCGKLGDFQTQKKLVEEAMPVLKLLYGENTYWFAMILINLSGAHGGLGEIQKQAELLNRAWVILEAQSKKNYFAIVNVLNLLEAAYEKLNNSDKREALLKYALTLPLIPHNQSNRLTFVLLLKLSSVYEKRGEVIQRKPLVERALSICENAEKIDEETRIVLLRQLGDICLDLKDPKNRKTYLERALEIQKRIDGNNFSELEPILIGLVNVYKDLGDIEKEKEFLARLLSVREKQYGVADRKLVVVLNELGERTLQTKGLREKGLKGDHEDFVKMRSCFERALAILEQHGDRTSRDAAIGLKGLCTVDTCLRKTEEAYVSGFRAYWLLSQCDEADSLILQGLSQQLKLLETMRLSESTKGTLQKQAERIILKDLNKDANDKYTDENYPKAVELYEKCLRLIPSSDQNSIASVCYSMGTAYWKNQDFESALKYLHRALTFRKQLKKEVDIQKVQKRIDEVNQSKLVDSPAKPFGEAQSFHAPANPVLPVRKSDDKLKKMYQRMFK